MLGKLFARWLDGWRAEPDPATLDTDTPEEPDDDEPLPNEASDDDEAAAAARFAQRRELIATGLVMANGAWDGKAAVLAAQAIILADLYHDYRRRPQQYDDLSD